jgi:hypothetical protein
MASNVMAARVFVLKVTVPCLPSTANGVSVHGGVDKLWDMSIDTWHEFRHPTTRAPLIVYKAATAVISGTTYLLAIFWGLGPDRATIDATLYPGVLAALRTSGNLVADWACDLAADGSLRCSAQEADVALNKTAAVQVKANWPLHSSNVNDLWRVRLSTDPQWTINTPPTAPTPPTGPATGPLKIGDWVA